jgi:catechol 2,3-dioxygenase-like lactoylglutathione lyase family enzyme
MVSQLHHVSIFVSDMDRARLLFEDILGFKIVWHKHSAGGKRLSALLGIPELEVELVYLRSLEGDVAVELSRLIHLPIDAPPVQFGGPGSTSLCLNVRNVDHLYEQVSAAGWNPLSACLDMRSPEGDSIRAFCFRTEDGLTLELVGKIADSVHKKGST